MKAIKPCITVVIPLYNKENEIAECLASVFNQTREADEVIVVDDGSKDASVDILLQTVEQYDFPEKVRLVMQANGGVSSARNTGIKESLGSHVAFLDADDTWHPDYLKEIDELVREYPESRAVATSYRKLQDKKEITPKIRFSKTLKPRQIMENYFTVASKGDLPFTSSSICIEKTLLQEIGGFPENEPMGEDQDVWAKTALVTPIAYSASPLSYYHLETSNRACERHFPDEECPFSKRLHDMATSEKIAPSLRQEILSYTATHLIHLAKLNIQSGNFKAAAELLKDYRCNYLKLKKMYCQCMLRLNTILYRSGNMKIFS